MISPKIPINGGVLNAKALSLPAPRYPESARSERVSGEVQVRIIIDENGNVAGAEAFSGPELLRGAAVDAARQAKFGPTRLQGEPVKVAGVLAYNFAIQ